MITSFYPGPSKVYEKVPRYVIDGYKKGIFSFNHRSPEFANLYRETIGVFRKRLKVPNDYHILFSSSATETWEIIAQSVIRESSLHIFNGAFGEKWYKTTKNLGISARKLSFDLNQELPVKQLPQGPFDLVAVTHNETSNGTMLSKKTLAGLRQKFVQPLLAVDATSSMAGVRFDWSQADIWYASVQKCFGIPPGLGVLVCSPKLIEIAKDIGENDHYNSLFRIINNADNFQTTHTPNIMGIYLLYKSLKDAPAIRNTEASLLKRLSRYDSIIESSPHFKNLVENPELRSTTVIAVKADEEVIDMTKSQARELNMILGNGYGEWKDKTFRIANFPALRDVEVKKLQDFLKNPEINID